MSWEIGAGAMPWVYAIGMLVIGFLLILLEIFLIPGINIFGILGFGTVCAAIATKQWHQRNEWNRGNILK